MTAVPKPPPRETSRMKGGRQNGRSKKWKTTEREAARWVQDNAGVDPEPPVEPTSTGRVGHLLQYDLTSKRYIGEVKNRDLAKWIHDAWIQLLQLAKRRGNRHVLMILAGSTEAQMYFQCEGKRARTPLMHIITPERHAELLGYEAAIRGDDAPITKADIFELIEWVEDSPQTDAA